MKVKSNEEVCNKYKEYFYKHVVFIIHVNRYIQTLVFTDALKSRAGMPDTVIRVHPIGHYSENISACTFSI